MGLKDEDLMNQRWITVSWLSVVMIEKYNLKRKTLLSQTQGRFLLVYIYFRLVQIFRVFGYIQFFFSSLFFQMPSHVKESFPFYTPSPSPILAFHLLIKQLIF